MSLFTFPEWYDRAACIDAGPDLFFPEARVGIIAVRQAKAICAVCPVSEECLSYAIDHVIRHGVWGGLTVRDRRVEAKRRRGAAA